MASGASQKVIGIDLGTTNCCLVACEDEVVTVLEIDGSRSMPSCVGFTDESFLTGRPALEQIPLNPTNTIVDAKRLIGRDFADKEVQDDLKSMHWPFLVQSDQNGRPQYIVRCLGEDMKVMPEMVGQLLLTKMRETAEEFFGSAIDGAVITVPAYFNDAQRQATKTAALQANLKVLPTGLINEPTAAALAYSRQYMSATRQSALVFDLGGGTFDVSLVAIDGNVVDVKATGGNNHLGGEDFTNNLVGHFLRQIQERFGVKLQDPFTHGKPGKSMRQLNAAGHRALLRLKMACEDLKCEVSSNASAFRAIDYLWPEEPRFTASLQRETFESINSTLFQQCIQCTEKVLRDGGTEAAAIDDVILVGGSTRMPKIKELLSGMFGSDKLRDHVNPDEVVAYGAGVHASGLMGLSPATLIDVAPHALGVATVGDVMSIVYPRNERVGRTKERVFTTTVDGQTTVTFNVYEGEARTASANHQLDSFSLHGVPRMRAGAPTIVVKFRVDYDGTLKATAMDVTQGGDGSRVRRALKVMSKRQETGIKEREEMALQTTKLNASKHRTQTSSISTQGYACIPVEA